ncbi:MAG TPA: hypothetical protein DEF42_18875 [Desulfosporosinus sp.]|nr:hypothetical protein [Desulfosporosinus sp.]
MNYKKFYILSLSILFLASIYPLYMGFVTLGNYLQHGFINMVDYQKYIIPYTPICIALIASAALMPLLFKLWKRYTLPVVSVLGILLFFAFEYGFEQIKVIEGYVEMPLESWQLSLCMATPEVLRSIGEPIYAANNPAFKFHFYLIAIVIILVVLNVIYGFGKMIREQNFSKKHLMIAQGISALLFISLCIFACFTAFYRNGTLHISSLSALLMSVFFTIFGITIGIYSGTMFYGKRKLFSKIIPALFASLTTLLMYMGELVLMDGVLFIYGKGFFFESLETIPFSPADLLVILCSGLITYLLMHIAMLKARR